MMPNALPPVGVPSGWERRAALFLGCGDINPFHPTDLRFMIRRVNHRWFTDEHDLTNLDYREVEP